MKFSTHSLILSTFFRKSIRQSFWWSIGYFSIKLASSLIKLLYFSMMLENSKHIGWSKHFFFQLFFYRKEQWRNFDQSKLYQTIEALPCALLVVVVGIRYIVDDEWISRLDAFTFRDARVMTSQWGATAGNSYHNLIDRGRPDVSVKIARPFELIFNWPRITNSHHQHHAHSFKCKSSIALLFNLNSKGEKKKSFKSVLLVIVFFSCTKSLQSLYFCK